MAWSLLDGLHLASVDMVLYQEPPPPPIITEGENVIELPQQLHQANLLLGIKTSTVLLPYVCN